MSNTKIWRVQPRKRPASVVFEVLIAGEGTILFPVVEDLPTEMPLKVRHFHYWPFDCEHLMYTL